MNRLNRFAIVPPGQSPQLLCSPPSQAAQELGSCTGTAQSLAEHTSPANGQEVQLVVALAKEICL